MGFNRPEEVRQAPAEVLRRPSEQPIPADAQWVRGNAHVDEEGPPDDVVARQEAPKAAVVGLVAVVAHHEVVRRGDDDRPPVVRGRTVGRRIAADVARQLPRPDLPQPELVLAHHQSYEMQRVRLVEALSVPVYRVARHPQRVAGGADDPLHDVEVGRRVLNRSEHHDAVAARLAVAGQRQQPEAGEQDLELAAVHRLVHEQEVPHEQRVLHARRGNAERLDQIGAEHDPDHHRRRERLGPPNQLFPQALPRCRSRGGNGARRRARGALVAARLDLAHRTRNLIRSAHSALRIPRSALDFPHDRAAATLRAASDGHPRQAVHRGETGRRLPVAGPQGRGHAAEDPGAARPDRRGERQTGPQGDAADLRGAEDGRAGEREPAASGHPRQRLRPPGAPVAGGQVGAAVTGRMRGAPPPPARHTDLEQLCINTVRTLAMDAVQQADSGHAGTAMALAPLAWVVWPKHPRPNPPNPDWPDRDRFVLSRGHACVLLYSALYLTGYDLTLEDLKQFRQWGSRTPGHSEHGATPGVEATTGPLGQGVGNAVGMAIAEAQLGALFNRPGHAAVDHCTYFVASDGDLMEGISHEACSLAGHLKLGKLIGIYDDNHVTIDGDTSLAFSDDTAKRFEAYGWHVQRVADGNDVSALDAALAAARRTTERPSLVIVRTHIAFGSPGKQDTAEAHGAPLGADEVKRTKQNLGWPALEPFHVPAEALAHWRRAQERGARLEADWRKRWDAYRTAHRDLAAELERRLSGRLPDRWDADLPAFTPQDGASATRAASGQVR